MSQPTAFNSLTAAVKALLLQDPPIAGGNVARRIRPLQQEQACAVVIAPAAAAAEPGLTGGPGQWFTTVVLELQARALAGQDPEDALDPLLLQVFERLQQLPAFAPGVADALSASRLEWDMGEADTGLAVVRLALGVQHRTAPRSLLAAP